MHLFRRLLLSFTAVVNIYFLLGIDLLPLKPELFKIGKFTKKGPLGWRPFRTNFQVSYFDFMRPKFRPLGHRVPEVMGEVGLTIKLYQQGY